MSTGSIFYMFRTDNDEESLESSDHLFLSNGQKDYFDDSLDSIRAFVDRNPYPDFNTIEQKLTGDMAIWAEYTLDCHNLCKQIYENLWDEEIIKECGQKINNIGGKPAMKVCYEVLTKHNPLDNTYILESKIRFLLGQVD